MADNTVLNFGSGGDAIATDDLTTLNGGAISGVKVQRVKVGYGVDGTQTDVTAAAPLPVVVQPSTLAVTAVSAANTAATLTLPAPGAGLFHYITSIELIRVATAAVTGSAVLTVTSTNLPGNLAWSFGNAMAIGGQSIDERVTFSNPLKSSVANTATTIVMPAAGAAVIYRANVTYFTGP